MPNTVMQELVPTDDSVVVPLFPQELIQQEAVPALTPEEILTLRKFMAEFAIIRATCPLAIRSLSKL